MATLMQRNGEWFVVDSWFDADRPELHKVGYRVVSAPIRKMVEGELVQHYGRDSATAVRDGAWLELARGDAAFEEVEKLEAPAFPGVSVRWHDGEWERFDATFGTWEQV